MKYLGRTISQTPNACFLHHLLIKVRCLESKSTALKKVRLSIPLQGRTGKPAAISVLYPSSYLAGCYYSISSLGRHVAQYVNLYCHGHRTMDHAYVCKEIQIVANQDVDQHNGRAWSHSNPPTAYTGVWHCQNWLVRLRFKKLSRVFRVLLSHKILKFVTLSLI